MLKENRFILFIILSVVCGLNNNLIMLHIRKTVIKPHKSNLLWVYL